MRALLLLIVVLTACCPAPLAGAATSTNATTNATLGTETAFVAEVLELRQDSLLVRTEAAPQEILSVRPGAPSVTVSAAVTVGARVYVRGLLSRDGVTRAEVSLLTPQN